MRRFFLVLLTTLGLTAAPVRSDAATRDDVENCKACEAVVQLALANPRRDADSARDPWRHPAETIAFFRIRPGMTVVDYMPSGGWWTRILVPYLGPDGHYIGLNPDVRGAVESQQQALAGLADRFPARAADWTGASPARIAAYNSEGVPAALDGQVDRVILMREVHNLYRFGWLHRELATVRTLLKPNGLLGIEAHRAKVDASDAYVDGCKGYMREKDVIALVEAEGFRLVARSDVNANPKDPADHPAGVWSLAPTLSQGDTDRARYAAIGESDRMTLLFRKRG